MENYLGRAVVKKVTIMGEGTFMSFYKAEELLREQGMTVGSMCGGEPIGFASKDKYEYIAKWRNIDPSERNKVEGVMVSNDWREGSVDIIYFT